MLYRLRSICLLAGLALLLGACASTPPPQDLTRTEALAQWQQHKQKLAAVTSWNLQGRMGVKTGPRGGSATLKWNYLADGIQEIELYGPFGGGRVIITVDEAGAVLRDSKGRTINGGSASDVLYQRLGWQVPFDQLTQWARGLHGATASNIVIDGSGRLKRMQEGNWQVSYDEYEEVTTSDGTLLLPARLEVSAIPGSMEIYSDEGEYLGDELKVKVVLKRWWEVASAPR